MFTGRRLLSDNNDPRFTDGNKIHREFMASFMCRHLGVKT
jgi:hypothetical protein